jgi:hypothetical protein
MSSLLEISSRTGREVGGGGGGGRTASYSGGGNSSKRKPKSLSLYVFNPSEQPNKSQLKNKTDGALNAKLT